MRISVTQDDIRLGYRIVACRCPIALALRRASGAELASASNSYLQTYVNGRVILNVPTPKAVMAFINNYDNGLPVLPFEFELND